MPIIGGVPINQGSKYLSFTVGDSPSVPIIGDVPINRRSDHRSFTETIYRLNKKKPNSGPYDQSFRSSFENYTSLDRLAFHDQLV